MSIPVRCDCRFLFTADAKLAGGFTNCPQCGKAVAVAGLRDPMWRVLQFGALVIWVLSVAGAASSWGVGGAVLTALGGALLIWMISRLF